jgi:quinol monooxygenase YgiN
MSKPLTIIAITRAAAGREKELRAAQEKLVAATLKEPGCLRYELNQSLDDGRTLIFVESWESEAAWKTHMEAPAITHFRANGGEHIEEFTLHRLTPVA